MTERVYTEKMIDFIQEIGLEIEFETLPEKTFLPGILIREGKLVVDRDKLKYPGDLLHEAGHLAVIPKSRRAETGAYVGVNPAEEMAAIAWSWAALKHLELSPEIVFHPKGYKGASQNLIDQFSQEHYIGSPILQWLGLCDHSGLGQMPESGEVADTVFPKMKKWLADELPV
ncbi:hypothetical protein [Oceanospirillum beijerinckii]|uniref:hypothetical protein n=1 Tax=Oceanospirillum beijerinckii TaxID=64976 RepID=UPI00042535D1|nr:hypothetical protein [Oceanospirillum beijerinckii]